MREFVPERQKLHAVKPAFDYDDDSEEEDEEFCEFVEDITQGPLL